jgi:signal transduction histidine kinase
MSAWWQRRPMRTKLALSNTLAAALLWLGLVLLAPAAGIWPSKDCGEVLVGLGIIWLLASLLFAAASYRLSRRALAPLQEMAQRIRQFSPQAANARLPVANAHDELGQLALAVNQTLQQLAEAFAQLDRLTANVSHELRTPLTAMRAVGEVALREPNPAVLHDAVGSMLEEVRRMNQLLERLLLLTRPGDKEMPLKLEAGLVRPTLLEVSDSLGLVAEEKQQRLEVDCPDYLLVVFDPALFRLALLNLVQNAIRYSPAGKSIRLRAMAAEQAVFIEVADEGPGIAAEHRQKIFERFYRVDEARSRAEGGVGLGLAIVKWAVERMGGTVELQSELGRGSTFRLRLRAVTAA